jgi:hypothetical protein
MEHSTKYTWLLDWANHAYERTERAARIVLQRPHTRQLHQLFDLATSAALQLQQQELLTSGSNISCTISYKLGNKLKPGTQHIIQTFMTPCNGEDPLKELLLGLVMKVNSKATTSAHAAGGIISCVLSLVHQQHFADTQPDLLHNITTGVGERIMMSSAASKPGQGHRHATTTEQHQQPHLECEQHACCRSSRTRDCCLARMGMLTTPRS